MHKGWSYPPPLLRGEDTSFYPKTIGNIKASNAQLGCQEYHLKEKDNEAINFKLAPSFDLVALNSRSFPVFIFTSFYFILIFCYLAPAKDWK